MTDEIKYHLPENQFKINKNENFETAAHRFRWINNSLISFVK